MYQMQIGPAYCRRCDLDDNVVGFSMEGSLTSLTSIFLIPWYVTAFMELNPSFIYSVSRTYPDDLYPLEINSTLQFVRLFPQILDRPYIALRNYVDYASPFLIMSAEISPCKSMAASNCLDNTFLSSGLAVSVSANP